ncbi:MAG TPA: tRNA (adenosine(37)-N6)-threonylcarbamoyltransferase complex transferase subunit TsaD [Candidatus Paceibacterota bacterium]|nr:tRNA (adenosine(37)-N6)-threonylcarbamoyltransferase complex transferase subunit TsaD [Candidatus Paceibacterota bacterium]
MKFYELDSAGSRIQSEENISDHKFMKILSIETSCDDTAISIMEAKEGITNASFKILANNSNSQIKIHIPYGGVYPKLAKREHLKNLPIILEASLKQAKLDKKNKPVDAIAVTYGPGLEMCLWEGITFAQSLGKKWDVPLIPANHMEGHVLSVFGKDRGKFKIPKIVFPILSLLVSGGHTQLVLTKKWMWYEIIGETLDDAVGEAFDKVARMLNLPYPGGPQVSKLAEKAREEEKQSLRGVSQAVGPRGSASRARGDSDPEKISFPLSLPRPMLHSQNFDFSFSGLKTAVLYLTRKIGKIDSETRAQIALEFENAAIECLVFKTKKAMEKYKIKTLIVAGGVAANQHLRNEMQKIVGRNIKLLFPTKELSGDNSLMIGIAGYLNYIKNKRKVPRLGSIKAIGNLRL